MEKYIRADMDMIGTELSARRFKYVHSETGKIVAFKRLSVKPNSPHPDSDPTEIGIPNATIREVSLFKVMKHENIVRLEGIETHESDSLVRLALEYTGVDLKKFLETEPEKASDQKLMKKFLYQLLCGVAYHHSIKAAHGNLNHKNVLIDSTTNKLKITNLLLDLGPCITYKAPELFLGSTESSPPADMFSIGCIFAEMVTKKPLFTPQTIGTELNSIFNLLGSPTEENWPGASETYEQLSQYDKIEPKDLSKEFPSLDKDGADLLSKLLCLDPSKRITAVDALKHNYFKDVKD